MDIKNHVGKDKFCHFLHYQDNNLWYRTEAGLDFPIPISDTGNGIFLPKDKSIIFMRWIRKHMKFIEDARKNNLDDDFGDAA